MPDKPDKDQSSVEMSHLGSTRTQQEEPKEGENIEEKEREAKGSSVDVEMADLRPEEAKKAEALALKKVQEDAEIKAAKEAEQAARAKAEAEQRLAFNVAQAAKAARSQVGSTIFKQKQDTNKKEEKLRALTLDELVARARVSAINVDYVNKSQHIRSDRKQEVDDLCSNTLIINKDDRYEVKGGCIQSAVQNQLISKILGNERVAEFLDPRKQVISVLIAEQKRLAKKHFKSNNVDQVLLDQGLADNEVKRDARERMRDINKLIGDLEMSFQEDLKKKEPPDFKQVAAKVHEDLVALKAKIYPAGRRLGDTKIPKAIQLVEENPPKEDLLHRAMRKFGMS